jgi:hypothetical protein
MKNELPPEAQPRHANDLIATARRIVHAEKRRQTLKRQLAETEGELKLARKTLRGLASALGSGEQLPPRFAKFTDRAKRKGAGR